MDIGGPFLNIIKHMYDKSAVQIDLHNGLTDPFLANIGVKQGCVLSPTLFRLFLHDINEIFSNSCHPAKLHNENISCLRFADDVVLMSESAEGLQLSIDKIKEYADKWLLKVNTDKSKIIIFN